MSDGPRPRKRRPGRPTKKERPLSPTEIANRRKAAWKTGEHSQAPLGQLVPPCKASTCPLGEAGYPCDLRRQRDEEGLVTERCAPTFLTDPATLQLVSQALQDEDPTHLQPLVAPLLAGGYELLGRELQTLGREGLAVERQTVSPEGDPLAFLVENPRARPTLDLMKLLGITAADQAVTPKARAQRSRDEGLVDLVDWLATARQPVPLAPPGDPSDSDD